MCNRMCFVPCGMRQATTAKLLSRRGYAATEPNKPLSPFTHSVGELGPSEIDIKVTHNGLCHTVRVGERVLGVRPAL